MSFSFFFSWYIKSVYVISRCSINISSVFWSFFFPVFFPRPFQERSWLSYKASVQVFIPLMKFLQQSFVSRSFLVLLRYSYFLFFISFVGWWPSPIFPRTCKLFFLRVFCFFPHVAALFLLMFVIFRFSWLSWHTFLAKLIFID